MINTIQYSFIVYSIVPRILVVFPLDQIADIVAPRSEDPKLIIRVNSFELTQHICPRYINVTYVTERRTDFR